MAVGEEEEEGRREREVWERGRMERGREEEEEGTRAPTGRTGMTDLKQSTTKTVYAGT